MEEPSEEPSSAPVEEPSEEPSVAPSEEPTEEPTDDGVLAFGETNTWEDKISLKISKPEIYKPSEYIHGEKGMKSVVMTVTLVNKSGKPFDPGMSSFSAQSANEEAKKIFDSGKGISGGPNTKLLNGREVKFKIAFWVLDIKDIVVEASPGWDHDSVIYQS